MTTLFENIGRLVQVEREIRPYVCGAEMQQLPSIENAYLVVEDDKIKAFGPMTEMPSEEGFDQVVDIDGRMILPAFCDGHTHVVYAGSREIEYIDKIKGLSYEEIAKRGGGILNSAKLLHNTSEDSLFEQSLVRVNEMMHKGTGAADIKSGYGLSVEDELKMLRVIKRLKAEVPMTIRANFLGAHAVPAEFKGRQGEYVDLICREMIPAVAAENLAESIDVFCDKGFFTVEETERMLEEGKKYGLIGKIHANELDVSGGVQVGVKMNALSVDHLERTTATEIECLRGTATIPTMLPGTSFFLGLPYGNARGFIDAGLPLALASDYNPGSTPSGDMKFVVSLACVNMKLIPEEAINCVTINGAAALGLAKTHGSIAVGKKANLIVTSKIPSIEFIPYAYTTDIIDAVMLNGNFIE